MLWRLKMILVCWSQSQIFISRNFLGVFLKGNSKICDSGPFWNDLGQWQVRYDKKFDRSVHIFSKTFWKTLEFRESFQLAKFIRKRKLEIFKIV